MDKRKKMQPQTKHLSGCMHSHDLHSTLQLPRSISDKGAAVSWASLQERAGFQPSEIFRTFLDDRGEVTPESSFSVKKSLGKCSQARDEVGAEARRGLGSVLVQIGGV